jgi:DNA invertase Pin-like site-specific DNA recombinase
MRRRKRQQAEGDPRVVVGYVRVSKEEQALGPEAQREAIARWCAAQGAILVAVHEDRLTSVSPIDRRPGFMAALADIAVHGAGVLVVAKRDRIARDPILVAMMESLTADAGARIQSAGGEANGDDPTSILMRRILDAFAEYERLMIKARTKAALAVKRRRGERIGGEVPYGWRLADDGVHLEPDSHEGGVVALARELRMAGRSCREVSAELAARGHVGRSGRPLDPRQVLRMVREEPSA